MHMYAHTYMHIYAHKYNAYMCTYKHVLSQTGIHTYTHTYMLQLSDAQTTVQALSQRDSQQQNAADDGANQVCMRMYVCIYYRHIHTYMRIRVCVK